MTGRHNVYWTDADGTPKVARTPMQDWHGSFEDDLIREIDSEKILRQFVKILSPTERRSLLLLLNGEGLPREHRNILSSIRRKAEVTNLRSRLL